jgi:predicted lipoprotein with Yx(FWY)xxD motif
MKLYAFVAAFCAVAPMAFAAPTQTVSTAAGDVLVNKDGMALYTFDKDAGGESACYDDCATAWPPFAAKAEVADEAGLTKITRKDGSLQWALNGQPLYFFAGDAAAGDVNGEGMGGVWHLARP